MKLFIQLLMFLGLTIHVAFGQNAPKQSWPHQIPARIRDSDNKDLMVMTLGNVNPVIADGTFDPVKVTGTLKTETAFTGLADAGYSIDAEAVELLNP